MAPSFGPKFDDAVLNPDNSIEVSGQFDTHADVIGDVIVGFLIIPDGVAGALMDPIVGEAKLNRGVLTKTAASAGNSEVFITSGRFTTTVNNKFGLTIEDGKPPPSLRIIGLSVAIKAPDGAEPNDPPGFETYTWCVNRKLVAPPPAADPPAAPND